MKKKNLASLVMGTIGGIVLTGIAVISAHIIKKNKKYN